MELLRPASLPYAGRRSWVSTEQSSLGWSWVFADQHPCSPLSLWHHASWVLHLCPKCPGRASLWMRFLAQAAAASFQDSLCLRAQHGRVA